MIKRMLQWLYEILGKYCKCQSPKYEVKMGVLKCRECNKYIKEFASQTEETK